MNNFGRFTALVCCSLAAASLFAEITTGWIQTGAGTYDYNATANWANGVINGVFSNDLTLEGAQTITFDKNTTFAEGLTIAQTGAFDITFTSNDDTVRTLELAGDFSNTGGGGVVFSTTVNVDLTGANRSFASDKNLTFNGILQNGGVIMTGTGEVHLNAANTYAGGSYFNCSGKVFFDNNSAFGAGTVRFRDGIAIACTKTISISENNPLVFEGDLSYSSKFNSNLGSGTVTFEKPCTFTINNGFTLGFPGQIAGERDWTSVTKSGNGSISTKAPVTLVGGETKEVCVTSGNWYFAGTISGAGTLRKTGGAYLQIDSEGTFNNFSGTFEIAAGSVRFMKKNVLSSEPDVKFLLTGSGVLRSNTSKDCGYAYSAAKLLPYVDTRSTGVLGISSNEGGDMDLSNYPYLRIAPNGDTFEYSGNIIAPSTGVLRIGGGGKTLKLSGTITGPTEIDATGGSIQFNVSQPGVVGNVTIGAGYTLIVGSSVELANADLVSDGGTIRFASATAGEFVRARSVTLNTAQLTVDNPSNGSVTHRVSGALKIGVYDKSSGGISCVTLTDSGENDLVLSVGSVSNVVGAEMLHVVKSVSGTGAAKFAVDDISGLGLVGSGAANTVTAPVSPFVRVDNSLATYTSEDGLRALNSSEYTVYEAGYEGPVLNAGENLATTGNGTVTLTGSATVNAIWMMGATGADQTLQASEGATITVASGAIQVNTYGAAKYDLPTDFGARRGYICARGNVFYNLYGSFAGTGGLTLADGATSLSGNGPNLYSDVNTYIGDTWIFCQTYPKASGFLPHAEELAGGVLRTGDVYLYGRMANNGANQHMNALIGAGALASSGQNSETIYFGYDNNDGDFSGTFGGGANSVNFGFVKVGAGKQRFSGSVGGKWNGTVNGGELQIDGTCNIGGRDGHSYHLVINEGILSGSGTVSSASGCGTIQINGKGIVFPGSTENPNEPLKLCKNVEMAQGAAMKFYIGEDRASQAIVAEGYGITGTATTIPVTVDCTVKKKGAWLLLEADTFNEKVFAFTTRPSGGRLVVKTDEATNRVQLWYEQTSGLYVAIR